MLSFYYTEKVALYVKSTNPLMKTLNEVKDTKYVSSTDSVIIDNTYIIPGLNGKEVNIDASFSNMHEYNLYIEENLVFNEIKPTISIEDNKDKIIINGNKSKQSVSLIFEDYSTLTEYMSQNGYNINVLINKEDYVHKYELINNSNQESTYNKIENYLTENNLNKEICYIKEDDKIPSLCKNKYSVKSSLVISHSNISSSLNLISSGDIILIKNSISLTELEIIINQVSYRNLKIIPLSKLISESN